MAALSIEFTATAGQTSYYSPLLNTPNLRVLREGLLQYKTGSNFIINTLSGSVFFFPALIAGERVKILI